MLNLELDFHLRAPSANFLALAKKRQPIGFERKQVSFGSRVDDKSTR